jgi:hypothetical protein
MWRMRRTYLGMITAMDEGVRSAVGVIPVQCWRRVEVHPADQPPVVVPLWSYGMRKAPRWCRLSRCCCCRFARYCRWMHVLTPHCATPTIERWVT